MITKLSRLVAIMILMTLLLGSVCYAGGQRVAYGPPLDETLMAFKEQGVWYFLCEAPVYPYRIPPHYLTFAPPPPPYCPVPCAPPAMAPRRPAK